VKSWRLPCIKNDFDHGYMKWRLP